jgi:hypothetical protein
MRLPIVRFAPIFSPYMSVFLSVLSRYEIGSPAMSHLHKTDKTDTRLMAFSRYVRFFRCQDQLTSGQFGLFFGTNWYKTDTDVDLENVTGLSVLIGFVCPFCTLCGRTKRTGLVLFLHAARPARHHGGRTQRVGTGRGPSSRGDQRPRPNLVGTPSGGAVARGLMGTALCLNNTTANLHVA